MAEKTEYAELTVDELKAELEKRELPKSGKKAELVTRLEDDDTAQGGTAPENEACRRRGRRGSEDEAPKPKRRGSEVSAGAKKRDRSESAGEAPRDKAGAVAVRAQAKFVRSAPRKARLVMDHIRGKEVARGPRHPAPHHRAAPPPTSPSCWSRPSPTRRTTSSWTRKS